ncbi:ParA family protein [Pseudomonas corrugata]|uniref:ParA family protein n=1 Tax=Pseudomonas corrugata TaxID=47879 RepID=UPI0018E5D2A2|nr:ParA family protein [Pseudomonas corrugata]MBI6621552.1 ParA family protein [Pseudomonas corrugata]MBI6694213.1 ParA family protein [Pseudomonas corrugata]
MKTLPAIKLLAGKMKLLAVANQKGGVSKSTTCAGVAYKARETFVIGEDGQPRKLRVLLVDFDAMGSLSLMFQPTGFHTGPEPTTSVHLFDEGATIVPEMLEPGFGILRSDKMLSQLAGVNGEGIKRPRNHLRALADDFDICLIDTPGVLGENPPMTIAALVATNAVICPISVGLFEADALRSLVDYIHWVRKSGKNPMLKMMGLLPSRINTRSPEEMGALAEVRENFGGDVLPLMLGERASVKQATAKRKPVWRGVKGAGHTVAAKEWHYATDYILNNMGIFK